MFRPTLRRFLSAVLLVGATANVSAAHITFSAGYDGPWEWDEVTMTTWTEGSGMNTATYYKGTACITGYSGIDPEVDNYYQAPGIDYQDKYPTVRTFTVGMNLKF